MKFCILSIIFFLFASFSFGFRLPDSFKLQVGYEAKLLAENLNPVTLEVLDEDRLLIGEKDGSIILVKRHQQSVKKIFKINNVDGSFERGLLGIEKSPFFLEDNYVYIYYTSNENYPHNKIDRIKFSGDSILTDSTTEIFSIDELLPTGLHNGGGLIATKNGFLYIGVGDGGDYLRSISPNILGKILRVKIDGSIPEDNPFYNDENVKGKAKSIFSVGVRNPFKLIKDTTENYLFYNEVGFDQFEEINRIEYGANYGWPVKEGIETNNSDETFKNPIFAYRHYLGCAITGGLIYQPNKRSIFPSSITGRYFFSDFCNGNIYAINYFENFNENIFSFDNQSIAKIAEGFQKPIGLEYINDGALFVLTRGTLDGDVDANNIFGYSGELWEITFTGTNDIKIATQPKGKLVSENGSVILRTIAFGGDSLRYQWFKNNQILKNDTLSRLYIDSIPLSDNQSVFFVKIFNNTNTVTSTMVVLTVIPNTLPIVNIIAPSDTLKFEVGMTLTFMGTAYDLEDGELDRLRFYWDFNFHHRDHYHPYLNNIVNTKSPQLKINELGETDSVIFIRARLRVIDYSNSITTVFKDYYPRFSKVVLKTYPENIPIYLDGSLLVNKRTFSSVKNLSRILRVDNIVEYNNDVYRFNNWSNGGDLQQILKFSNANDTLIAYYEKIYPEKEFIETKNTNALIFERNLIYPNPTVNNTIQISNPENKSFQIEIYDYKGILILKTVSNESIQKIKLSNNGLYLVKIIDENIGYSYKVDVQ